MGLDWTAVKQETGTWLFSWDGEIDEDFAVWLDGELLETVTGDEYEYTFTEEGYDDVPPPLEIVSADPSYPVDAENDLYPPYAIIQWREVSGADAYQVEEYVGTSWINRGISRDASLGYYKYETDPLTDDTATDFRVKAVDVNNNAGVAVEFTAQVVRNPAPPDVSLEIDSAGDLVISEA